MKTKFWIFACIFWTMNMTAFGQAFKKGESYVSLGYGYQVVNTLNIIDFFSMSGYNSYRTGPMSMKYEYGLSSKIGLGLSAVYSTMGASKTTISNTGEKYIYNYNLTKLTVTPRFNFHFGKYKKFDPYLGLGIGYKYSKLTRQSNDPSYLTQTKFIFPMSLEAVVGLRYFLSDNFGLFGEAGISHGALNGGLVVRF